MNDQPRPSHVAVASPNKPRPADPLVRALSDTLYHIALNYAREGSGPGSRFEGMLLEDVQAGAMVRQILAEREEATHLPPVLRMVGSLLCCVDHGTIVDGDGLTAHRLVFEGRRHWREAHS